ncbi:MAG: sigma-70 family RNA polymerase sigma factor [Desulfatiglans sp.]|jgi:RNA polymerase sigma-70 factor (ECF subfamily)|nr:sigma-70 family RNA polymerase sigma factor [Desulfatiglans sp.]
MADSDEDRLVLDLKNRDEKAYGMLVSQYQAKLRNVAYGITLDAEESADIIQDVFLKAYTGIERFKGESSLYTWLRRITINESLNWVRKWKRRFRWQHQSIDQEEGNAPDLVSDRPDPEESLDNRQLSGMVKKALESLPEKARTILILKEVEGLSYDEIGELMGINKGTVSSRIFYAREKLRESLKGVESEGQQ